MSVVFRISTLKTTDCGYMMIISLIALIWNSYRPQILAFIERFIRLLTLGIPHSTASLPLCRSTWITDIAGS